MRDNRPTEQKALKQTSRHLIYDSSGMKGQTKMVPGQLVIPIKEKNETSISNQI